MPLFGGSNQGGAGSFFQKLKSGASSLFGGINRGAGAVSDIAGKAGSILGTISNIAKNPIIQTIAGGLGQGDNLAKFASATGQGANLAQKVGGISSKVADISSPSTYFNQPAVPAVRNAVERAKSIFGDIKGLIQRPLMGGNQATYSPYNSAGIRITPMPM